MRGEVGVLVTTIKVKRPGGHRVPRYRSTSMADYRRILLDGVPTEVIREDDELVADDGRRIAVEQATHLPPVEPTKIIAVHLNYRSRVEEFMTRLPPAPTYFHKPITALNSHRGEVVRPPGCRYLNYEGEIAIVIGSTCRNIAPEEAEAYIAGYTIANDFGLHDFRDTDAGSMLRVKGSDTLCPLGPGLVMDWDFRGKTITTRVNDEVRQEGSTDEMEWDMAYLVADLARTITLVPGDVILSGTPAGSRPVEPGDVVAVTVEGLGELTSPIVEGNVPIRSDVGAQPSDSEEVVSTALGGDWEHRGLRAPVGPGSAHYESHFDA
jgi:5-oxopent-3-ene-1,2,5-tricarboxylate decarboxylase / 2-hydroxyhepta-2,4-diene-1,7-dioate isomerase